MKEVRKNAAKPEAIVTFHLAINYDSDSRNNKYFDDDESIKYFESAEDITDRRTNNRVDLK